MTSQPYSKPHQPFMLKWLWEVKWGGSTLISLYISVLSGLILALQYNGQEAFYSTATIELIVPFGWFWRALHYYSSQAFFFLLVIHLAMILWQNDSTFTRSAWLRLTASVPVALLLLFTGYVLRGDATGEAAGTIAEHISLSIPVLGKPLNHLLFDISRSGLTRVYANHLIGLMVLGGICVWPHLRRYTARFRNHLIVTLLIITIAVALHAPMEPERFGLLHIAGPWFFLGLQELLRYIPPFWAGVAIPMTLLLPLLFLPKGKKRRICVWGMLLWLLVYGCISILSYQRVHSDNRGFTIQKPTETSAEQVTIPETMK